MDKHLEELLTWTHAKFGARELVQAKEEFFWMNGKVFHDDSFYDERMNYFTDFFLLERPLRTEDERRAGASYKSEDWNSPLFLHRSISSQVSSDTPLIRSFRHSIFCITQAKQSELILEDLINGESLKVYAREGENLAILEKNQLLQGFLYLCTDSKIYLSQGILYFPKSSFATIRKEVRNFMRSDSQSVRVLLGKTAKQHMRFLRNPSLDPKKIFSETPHLHR